MSSFYEVVSPYFCALSTPFKKVKQQEFDRLYFFHPGFVFIKLAIPGKPVYLPFY